MDKMIRLALYQAAPYAEMLSYVLNNTEGFCVAGSFFRANDIERGLHQSQPDVLLINTALEYDTSMIGRIKRYAPELKIVVLTDVEESNDVMTHLIAGVNGYLLIRRTSLPTLMECIKAVVEGGFPMNPMLMSEVLTKLLPKEISVREVPHWVELLTMRERDVLQLIAKGASYKDISFDLNISLDTVRSHIKKIYEKLKVNSKSEAVAKVLRGGAPDLPFSLGSANTVYAQQPSTSHRTM
jgi:DNA-binding NarL/FixJ family response regulator